jgi:hypothetical protein
MNSIDFVFDIYETRVFASWEFNEELLKNKEVINYKEFIEIFKIRITKITKSNWEKLWNEKHLNSHTKQLIYFIRSSIECLCVSNEELKSKAFDGENLTVDWITILWKSWETIH